MTCQREDERCLEPTAIVQISSAALRISLGGGKASGGSCSLASAKCIAPLSFGLHQCGQEGNPDNWVPQDFHVHRPGVRPGEFTSVPLFTASEPPREVAVTSYKPRRIGVSPGPTGCLRRWEGSSSPAGWSCQLPPASSWAAPASKVLTPPQSACLDGCLELYLFILLYFCFLFTYRSFADFIGDKYCIVAHLE